MKSIQSLFALTLLGAAFSVAAQSATPVASTQAPPAWKYKVKHLSKDEIDALLANPEKLLVLDLRRPNELITYGSFPAFLSIQASELEQNLAYLPKDRIIVTVSNHAGRAGIAGDFLAAKGYTVAGAAGSEDYEKAGGKSVRHIQPAPPLANASAPG
jgi:rhodanese-related sulfurtransferase